MFILYTTHKLPVVNTIITLEQTLACPLFGLTVYMKLLSLAYTYKLAYIPGHWILRGQCADHRPGAVEAPWAPVCPAVGADPPLVPQVDCCEATATPYMGQCKEQDIRLNMKIF